MRKRYNLILAILLLLSGLLSAKSASAQNEPFSLTQIMSFPYPTQLTASPKGSEIAWVINLRGVRNVWMAQGPDFKPVQMTHYTGDTGREITHLMFSPDGKFLIFVRGGDHGANWTEAQQPDPDSDTEQPHLQIVSVPVSGGKAVTLGEGDAPAVAAGDDRVAFIDTETHNVWWAPIDGSTKAERLFYDKGIDKDLRWSPDGSALAFVSNRGDHSFIGVFTTEQNPIKYMVPSTNRDFYPRWSHDGTQIAFVRRPGKGGTPVSLLTNRPKPWSIWVANASSGIGRKVWSSPATLHGSYPATDGGANLHWGSDHQIVFLADLDGWPHLYSLNLKDGEPEKLTSGSFMVEDVSESPDHGSILYCANTGQNNGDIDRRHIYRVSVNLANAVPLTAGNDIEWSPVTTGDGQTVAFIRGGALQPPLVMVQSSNGGNARPIDADLVPSDFPTGSLVVPRDVTFRSDNGLTIHGQLFERGGSERKPAIIFVHGGPSRQMLLGWHYMHYYANAYAMNQYLVSKGFIVLSVNYRLGIGYGYDFHHPGDWGPTGASEYRDILAAAHYLQKRDDVDKNKIGIWGGSYGGYLTALALARNSDIFKAGVDMHGVHDWSTIVGNMPEIKDDNGYEQLDKADILKEAWESSPDAYVDKWRSPVLLIQGDDDRNVHFHQMVDLVQRLKQQKVPMETLVLPNEIHEFLRYESWIKVYNAAATFFNKHLKQ